MLKKTENSQTEKIWVAPSQDYCMVRHAIETQTGAVIYQADFDYQHEKQVGWVPVRWRVVSGKPTSQDVSINSKVARLKVGTPIPKEDFQLEFPKGTQVREITEDGHLLNVRYIK